MKVVKILVITILVLCIVSVIGVVVFLKTFDINRYKAQITAAAEKALNRTVGLGAIGLQLSLNKGIELRLENISIGENPDFGNGDFLVVPYVSIGVSIKDLIFKRQVTVLSVEAQSPQITVIRNSDGSINAQSLAAPSPKQEKEPPEQNTQKRTEPGAAPLLKPAVKDPAALQIPAIVINRIRVDSARLRYIDKTFVPELSLELKKVTVTVNNFSLTDEFPLAVNAAFLSDSPNITLKGSGEVNRGAPSFLLKDALVTADLSSVSMDALRRAVPQLNALPRVDFNPGTLSSSIKRLEVNAQGLKALALDAELNDGMLSMPEAFPGFSLPMKRVGATVKGFSLDAPFTFTLDAAYLSQTQNIHAEGTAQVHLDNQSIEITNTDAVVDLSSLSMAQLAATLKDVPETALPKKLAGRLKLTVNRLSAAAAGLQSLKAEGVLKDGMVDLPQLSVPVSALEAHCTISESAIDFDRLAFSLGKGKAAFSGSIRDYLKEQEFQAGGTLASIDLAECLDQSAYPVKVKGIASGNATVKGQGFDPKTFLSKLSGDGVFEVKEGGLSNVNVLAMAMDKLSIIPKLVDVLKANLPENAKEQLERTDTAVPEVRLTAALRSGSIVLEPVHVEAEGFLFDGNGNVGFDQQYAFDGTFTVPEALASRMASAVPEMFFLVNQEKRIAFPLTVSGKGPVFSLKPDLKSLGTSFIQNKGREQLGKVLDRVFNKKKESTSSEGTSQFSSDADAAASDSAGTSKENKKEEIKEQIQGILDTIFKK